MDFNKLKCPACNTALEDDDDIVVCPECGAPHHRECYDELGHCYFQEKHKDNFDYDKYIKEQNESKNDADKEEPISAVIKCKICGENNPRSYLYCHKCNAPLHEDKYYTRRTGEGNENKNAPKDPKQRTIHPEDMPFISVMYDPMAGLSPDEEMDDGVTAGELAKYTQKNTNYFLRVFSDIRDYNKSRFNFSAFLFSGAYMLYRKMYKLGALFTCIVGLLVLAPILIETLPFFGWEDILVEASSNLGQVDVVGYYSQLSENIGTMPFIKQFIFYLPFILSLLKWVFMFIAGAIANKAYFKDAVKKIKKVKQQNITDERELSRRIQIAGGVNTLSTIVILICYIIVNYIPFLF